ncbi:MAG: hypothetical protein HY290_05150 [Planctomycetia bacterium]|nr:hypothetical protein [Planctomycetia bacterium]
MKYASVAAWLAPLLVVTWLAGCGGDAPAPSEKKKPARTARSKAAESTDDESTSAAAETVPKRKYQPISLGGDAGAEGGAEPAAKSNLTGERRSQAVVAALQPLQVLLGQWRWITNRQFEGTKKSGEDLQWIWDFKHDKNQPSLTAKSSAHPYFKQVWLTYVPDDDKFLASADPVEGEPRVFRGTWTDGGEPKEESDGKKIQHTHKLQLTQISPAEGDQWQLVFSQLDNNQYLMTMTRRPATGKQFGPLDVVRQQRLGTSFAVADSDNPGPKCIISGGLGTMNVTYKGKSYPVCCSGCAAAFNDDPERWLAKLAEREKQKKPSED